MNPCQSDGIFLLNETGNEFFKVGSISEAAEYYKQAICCLTGSSSGIRVRSLKLQHRLLKLLHTQASPLSLQQYDADLEDFDYWHQVSAMSVMFNMALVYFVTNKIAESEGLLVLVLRAAGIQIPVLDEETRISEILEEIESKYREQFCHVVVCSLHLLGQILCLQISPLNLNHEQFNDALDDGIRSLILGIKLGRSYLTRYHPVIGWICSTLGHALIKAHRIEEAIRTFEYALIIAANVAVSLDDGNHSTAPAA